MIDEAKAVDERAKVISAAIEAKWEGYSVGNSRGILEATRSCYNDCQVNVYAIEGEERRGSSDFDVAVDRVYNTDDLGKNAAEYAIGLLGAKKLDMTTKMPTIWTEIPLYPFEFSSGCGWETCS